MDRKITAAGAATPSGVLVLDKPAGMTSHDAVNAIRRLYGTRQVGHTGTLDPIATGVLPILVGRAAKAAEFLGSDRKEYLASLRLGIATDTEDITGQIQTTCQGRLPDFDEVQKAALSFVGKSEQLPPMYSAIKIGGKKLVDLARQQMEVERPTRPIEIFAMELSPLPDGDISLRACCSKGTYMRSLCRDIGEMLGCGGCMSGLRRLQSGRFSLEDAYTIEQLSAMAPEDRLACLLPVERLFTDAPRLRLSPFFEHLARNGQQLYLQKLNLRLKPGRRVRLYTTAGSFFAIGEVRHFPDGDAIKPLRQFDLGN